MRLFLKKVFLSKLALSLAFLGLIYSNNAWAKPVSVCMAENHPIHWVARHILKKIYKHAGIGVEFIQYPNLRSLETANNSGCDAEAHRIVKVTEKFTNLRAVPSPIMVMEARAFVKKGSNISAKSWDDLNKFSIAIMNGEIYAMQATKGRQRGIATSYKNLFGMLIYRNIDVGIGLRVSSVRELADSAFADKIEMLPTPLFSTTLHHLVHKDKPELAKQIDAAIIDLRNQGLMDQYLEEAVADLAIAETLD